MRARNRSWTRQGSVEPSYPFHGLSSLGGWEGEAPAEPDLGVPLAFTMSLFHLVTLSPRHFFLSSRRGVLSQFSQPLRL